VPDFAPPKAWWDELAALIAGDAWLEKDGTVGAKFWMILGFAAAVAGTLVFLFKPVRRSLVWLVPLVSLTTLVVYALRAGGPATPPKGVEWVPVIFAPLVKWADQMSEPVVFTALAILLPGLILYYCGPTWGQRAKRVVQFALVSAALVGCCLLIYKTVNAKFEKEVAQVLEPATKTNGAATADVLKRHSESKIAQARATVEHRYWQSIFMPRYLGFVWIAFCVALCALLMRLPTRGLRFAAVLLLVGVNLAQFSGRLFAGTEPPLDRVARELWSQDSHNPKADPTTEVYINDALVGASGHPGYGTLSGQQGKYYLGLARGYWIHPSQWKRGDGSVHFDFPSSMRGGGGGRGGRGRGGQGMLDYDGIASSARRSTTVNRIIVWEKYFDETVPRTDRLSGLLGDGWRVVSEEEYNVRFHWTWQDLYVYRRSEYVRK
jgi:hypothetical protein